MNTPVRRIVWALLAGFVALILATTWIQAVAGPEYRDDPRNPRLSAWRVGRERGAIITEDGVVAGRSDPSNSRTALYLTSINVPRVAEATVSSSNPLMRAGPTPASILITTSSLPFAVNSNVFEGAGVGGVVPVVRLFGPATATENPLPVSTEISPKSGPECSESW